MTARAEMPERLSQYRDALREIFASAPLPPEIRGPLLAMIEGIQTRDDFRRVAGMRRQACVEAASRAMSGCVDVVRLAFPDVRD